MSRAQSLLEMAVYNFAIKAHSSIEGNKPYKTDNAKLAPSFECQLPLPEHRIWLSQITSTAICSHLNDRSRTQTASNPASEKNRRCHAQNSLLRYLILFIPINKTSTPISAQSVRDLLKLSLFLLTTHHHILHISSLMWFLSHRRYSWTITSWRI